MITRTPLRTDSFQNFGKINYGMNSLWQLFLVFLLSKFAGWIDWNWFLVFTPLFFQFLVMILFMISSKISETIAPGSLSHEYIEMLQRQRLEEVERQKEAFKRDEDSKRKALEEMEKKMKAKNFRPVVNIDKIKNR